jgi:hypothetical protein
VTTTTVNNAITADFICIPGYWLLLQAQEEMGTRQTGARDTDLDFVAHFVAHFVGRELLPLD